MRPIFSRARLLLAAGALALAAPARAADTAAIFADPTYQAGLAVWRAPRVKGECMSCHGPDFIDLARIGISNTDIARRATIDGASADEVTALQKAVAYLRTALALPRTNPLTFRPLQPGGAVLKGATPLERDLALAGQLRTYLPALMGAPIRTLAQAQALRDQFLAVDFNKMKIGIPFPLWSADIFHGTQFGTMNDWIADVSRKPVSDAAKTQLLALHDAYLADPSDLNFWKVYFATNSLTALTGEIAPVDPADAAKGRQLAGIKFRASLIGEHVLRSQALGRNIAAGQVPFGYLSTTEPYRTLFNKQTAANDGNPGEQFPTFLPNPMWLLGDAARANVTPSALTRGQPGNVDIFDAWRDRLRVLGYPQFVIDSVAPTTTVDQATTELRVAWFMIGFRFDPGLQRISQSNSTLVGEYLQGNLWAQDMFLHRLLVEGMREVVRAYRPEASYRTAPPFNLFFSYFAGYNRAMPTRLNWPANQRVTPAIAASQLALFKRAAANFFRMALLLHEQGLDSGAIKPYGNGANGNGDFKVIASFLDYAGQPNLAGDKALLARVAAKAGVTL